MFRGLTAITVDAKGRLAIPTRYRASIEEEAKGRLVATINTMDSCLLLYTLQEWEAIEEKLSQLSSFHPATRRIQRLLIGHATDMDMDRSGRILLPALLRDYAQIDSQVMLVGQGNKFELWAEERWREACHEWLDDDGSDEDGNLPSELAGLSL